MHKLVLTQNLQQTDPVTLGVDPSIFKLLVGVRILPRSACNHCTQCPELGWSLFKFTHCPHSCAGHCLNSFPAYTAGQITVQIHLMPTQLCWSLFKFTHCPHSWAGHCSNSLTAHTAGLVTVQIHSLPTQLRWSLFKFTHRPHTPTETPLSPVAGAVALGAVPRQVAHATAVVALAVIHTAVSVRAVTRQVASLSAAEARTRADLGAITLNVASHVAVVASS